MKTRKTEARASDSSFLRQYWETIRPLKPKIVAALVLSLCTEGVFVGMQYVNKELIDALVARQDSLFQTVCVIAGLYLAIGLAGTFFREHGNRASMDVLLHLERDLPSRALHKLLTLSLGYHITEKAGKKIGVISRGVSRIMLLTQHGVFQLTPIVMRCAAMMAILFVLDPLAASVLLVFMPLVFWRAFVMQAKMIPLRTQRQKMYEKSDGQLGEAVHNVQTIQSFGAEDRESGRFGGFREHIYQLEKQEWWTVFRAMYGRIILVRCAQIAVMVICVWRLQHNAVTIGTVVLFLNFSMSVLNDVDQAVMIYDRYENAKEPAQKFFDLMREVPGIRVLGEATPLQTCQGAVTFEHVSFTYRGREETIRDFDLVINPGETVALVGRSGSGKTTVARLLLRYFDVHSGCIRVDGVDIRTLDPHVLRGHIGIVSQEVEVFSGTIAENIRYGRPDATDEEVIEAAKLAAIHDFIQSLSNAYETEIGERGIDLSGGQRQRIGIARAILRNPAILIFDEATSHLDSQSEKEIQGALERVRRDRTMIVIAHRLSTTMSADRIIVLDNGVVVEQGTHMSLMARHGSYASLVQAQQERVSELLINGD